MAELTHDQVVDYLSNLPPGELGGLIKELEGLWGVSAPVAVQVQQTQTVVEPVEEQTEFSVTLTAVGPNKIQVIKVVRELTSLGLKEAKDLVDAAQGSPQVLKEAATKEEAAELKSKIEAAGATVTVK